MTDKARLEQIVGECLVKAAQIVLVSRINAPTKPVAPDQRKCWARTHALLSPVPGYGARCQASADDAFALHAVQLADRGASRRTVRA